MNLKFGEKSFLKSLNDRSGMSQLTAALMRCDKLAKL